MSLDGDGGDHEVGYPAPWFASGADHGGADSAVDAGCFGVEGDGVELVLGALQDVQAPAAFRVFVVVVLLLVPAHLVGPGGEFGQGDGGDGDLGGEFRGVESLAQDDDGVSSRPWAYSAGVGIVRLLICCGVLVGPERFQ